MVTRVRTIDFLPEIFKTKTNEQFLNATLDNLVQLPDFRKIQGFIGSKFGYGVDAKDKYLSEISKVRNDYQLEPAVIFQKKDTTVAVDLLTYPGIVDALRLEGGITPNHNKLFNNEFYSWDSFADLDKLINFGQYYWLPEGPEPVVVTTETLLVNASYSVTANANSYDLSVDSTPLDISNPTLTLVRGGSYTFDVNQASKFWIQTAPGVTGVDVTKRNISTREVAGVELNGTNKGTITFNVPQTDYQDEYNYPGNVNVDLVTTLTFDDINGKPLRDLVSIDGVTGLDGKTLMFYGSKPEDMGYISQFYDEANFNEAKAGLGEFEAGIYSSINNTIYKITLIGTDSVIRLVEEKVIPDNIKITVTSGKEFITRNFVKNSFAEILLIPPITSKLDTLYYQDGSNDLAYGKIILVDNPVDALLNINEIVGKKFYTSPNGIKFTNGLKVHFTGRVFPDHYLTDFYYVEGVGTSIQLIPVRDLIVPEPFSQSFNTPFDEESFEQTPFSGAAMVPYDPDYITINRSSIDLNGWSRSNRWFHVDVLKLTVERNTKSPLANNALKSSDARAKRPIIEFNPHIKLLYSGSLGKSPIDFIDFTTPDALSNISGVSNYQPDGASSALYDGARIIFAGDTNIEVRNKIFVATIATVDGNRIVTLSKAADGDVNYLDQVIVTNGDYNKGFSFYFDGAQWINAQRKERVNQPPLFDIFDSNGISFSDLEYYPGTDFNGSTLFQYAVGSGTDDVVLKFPIKYSGVGNLSDITFDVTLNSQTFNYVSNNTSINQPVNTGYVHVFETPTSYRRKIGWETAVEKSFQYQVFNLEYIAATIANQTFVCDVAVKSSSETNWPTVVVYVDNSRLDPTSYTVTTTPNRTIIVINDTLTDGVSVDILLYSDQVSETGYYQIPSNLDHNPFNDQITLINSGDIRGHYKSICNNVPNLIGAAFGANNYRDLGDVVPYGTKIIQNSAPLAAPAAVIRKQSHNFFNSIDYNATEYVKFKSLLVATVDSQSYTPYDSSALILDDALDIISSTKSDSSPFFWSDMLPSKTAYVTNSYTFKIGIADTVYPLVRTYDFANANYYGVLVYVTRTVNNISQVIQLVRNVDYVIANDASYLAVIISLQNGDVVTVKEYNQTYGSFVPNTPTKMGMYPKFIPEVLLDDTYLTPTYFLKGHDGSMTKLYGEYNDGYLQDFRDKALYEFETRVYNNLKVEAKIPLEADDIIPGQFRTTDYSREEILTLYNTSFLNWVGLNRVGYMDQYYDGSNEFTWNYAEATNKLDNTLYKQANWRGIYLWLYDTATPHTTPWEMLGLSNKPVWWDARYGSGPYTSDNKMLWTELSEGYVWNDGVPYINSKRVRPDLSKIIPVDSTGKLLSPFTSSVSKYNQRTFNKSWNVGDVGPAEYSYLKSSTWPFDLMRMLALTKPATFFTLGMDLDVYKYNPEFGQYLVYNRFRSTPADLIIYGTDATAAAHSYFNWMVDYLQQFGLSGSTIIYDLLTSLDVRLTYRLAGYSDKTNLSFYVEKGSPNSKNNSLLIPDDSYTVMLYNNEPDDTIVYSSVIVQKTINGFKVYGNSQNKAYFKSLKPLVNGNYDTVTVLDASVTYPKDTTADVELTAYGFEFKNVQDLVYFICGYNNYLESQGMVFRDIENSIQVDWSQMVAELLYWIQSGWEVGSTINLNPAANLIEVNRENSVLQPLTAAHSNFILNQNLLPVQVKDLAIMRKDNLFSAKALKDGDSISFLNADMSNTEHVVVFDNNTVFNDVIFNLSTGLRQQRLYVRGTKTNKWNGTIEAPGFILNQDNVQEWQANAKYTKGTIVQYKREYWMANVLTIAPSTTFNYADWLKTNYQDIHVGLIANPSTRSHESSLYYDTNRGNLENDGDLLGYSLIGYRPRPYLADANLDDSSQVNVYKEMILGKGTLNTLKTLQGVDVQNNALDYNIYENWAIKSSEFGGVLNHNFVEFTLNETQLTGNPAIIGITNGIPVTGAHQQVPLYNFVNYGRTLSDSSILPTIKNDTMVKLPDSGYVNLDDVALTGYTVSRLDKNTVYDVYANDYVWIADNRGTWNVYTPVTLSASLISVLNNLNGTATLIFDKAHDLSKYDPLGIINYDFRVDGYYTVSQIVDHTSVVVSLSISNSVNLVLPNGNGLVFKLQSQRLESPKDLLNLPLMDSEYTTNTVWIDKDVNNDWVVYRKTLNYAVNDFNKANANSLNNVTYGTAVAYLPKLGYYVSDPGVGKLYKYIEAANGGFLRTDTITKTAPFGQTIARNEEFMVVSKPSSLSSQVYVYRIVQLPEVEALVEEQVITIAGGYIGTSMAFSGDGNFLYLSATSFNSIIAFHRDVDPTYLYTGIALHDTTEPLDKKFVVTGNKVNVIPPGKRIALFTYSQYKNSHITSFGYEPTTGYTLAQAKADSTKRRYYIVASGIIPTGTKIAFDPSSDPNEYMVTTLNTVYDTVVGTTKFYVDNVSSTLMTDLFQYLGSNLDSLSLSTTTAPVYQATTVLDYVTIITGEYDSVTNTTTFHTVERIGYSITPSNTYVRTVNNNYSLLNLFGAGTFSQLNDNFGSSIATNYDGTKLFVGAPNANFRVSTDTSIPVIADVGFVYAFSRLVETWQVQYDSPDFSYYTLFMPWSPGRDSQIFINGVRLSPSKYIIVLNLVIIGPRVKAGDTVTLSSTNFVLDQQLSSYESAAGVIAGQQFGTSVSCNATGSELIVGCPYDVTLAGQEGAVYRFTNEGKRFGRVTAFIAANNQLGTSYLLINGFSVPIPMGDAYDIADAINAASVTNVFAYVTSDDRLSIRLRDMNLFPDNNKLNLSVFNGNYFYEFGIAPYTKTQVIREPHAQNSGMFGYRVQFNEFNSFVVTAPMSARFLSTKFDFSDDSNAHNDTVFDNNLTKWEDKFTEAGAAYVYDYVKPYAESLLNTGQYVYAQSVNDLEPNYGSRPFYGKSIAFNDYSIMVGSPNFKSANVGGRVVIHENSKKQPNWSSYRKSSPVVDTDRIQKVQLYDNLSDANLDSLDYFDPLRGKLLGAVSENVDFISSSDPAGYNNPSIAKGNIVWGNDHLGKLWFNTSTTKFVNYHQNDLVYNAKHWGSVFPGSTVTVYTWIESDVTPAFYVGSGTPYDFERYSVTFAINANNTLVPKYYFWARNTNSISVGKTLTDAVIEQYISNPVSSGISYFAPLRPDAYALYNAREYINGTQTNMHIGFSTGTGESVTHNEFKLIRSNYPEDFLPGFVNKLRGYTYPESLYDRMLDSFAGVDETGATVPNINLPSYLQIGINVRPRQGFYINRFIALKNYLEYANDVLAQYPVSEFGNLTFLTTFGDYYDTRNYWAHTYWWATGYDDKTKTAMEVSTYPDLLRLTTKEGLIVGVAKNSQGKREVHLYTNGVWTRIGLQDGTIKFLNTLWDYQSNKIGFGDNFYDTVSYDVYPSTETRNIIRALNEQIYTGPLLEYRNKSLILMFEYIQSENTDAHNYLPWLNKTSFADVVYTARGLVQEKKYQRDNENLISGFINEVKPYHTIVKDFSLKYKGIDTLQGDITDFDLPPKYNATTDRFETPKLTYGDISKSNNEVSPTDSIWNSSDYSAWASQYGLTLTDLPNEQVAIMANYITTTSNSLYVDNARGIPTQGIMIIDSEIIGYAHVDRETGLVSGLTRGINNSTVTEHFPGTVVTMDLPGVVVLDTGRGYIDPPTVTAYIDTSVYPKPAREAVLVPIMSGDMVIGVNVVDPGENYVVAPEILISSSYQVDFAESQINFINYTILVPSTQFKTGDLIKSTAKVSGSAIKDGYYYVYVVAKLEADEIIAITLHKTLNSSLKGESKLVFKDVIAHPDNLYTFELTARAIPITSNSLVRGIQSTLRFDRTSYVPKVRQWKANEFWSSPFDRINNEKSSSSTSTLYYTKPYTGITGTASISGSTDATFTVNNVLLGGTYSITVTNHGEAYRVNDTITVPGSALAGVNSINDCIITVTAVESIYTNQAGDTTSGTGSGARFDIVANGSTYVATVNPFYLGTGYKINDTITLGGSRFNGVNGAPQVIGGLTGGNDLTIYVANVTTDGRITEVSTSGIPVHTAPIKTVSVSGLAADAHLASYQGAVLPITNIIDDFQNTVVALNYTPTILKPGQIQGVRVYFYHVGAPYVYDDTSNHGAKIEIHRPRFNPNSIANQYYIKVVDSGSIYNTTSVIVVPGSVLGGVNGKNDATIRVKAVNNDTHAIQLAEVNGTAAPAFSMYYVDPIDETQVRVYKDAGMKVPVKRSEFVYLANSTTDFAYIPEPIFAGSSYKYDTTSIVTYDSKVWRCVNSNNDTVFDKTKWAQIQSDDRMMNALDRIVAFYEPAINMPPKDLQQLVKGISYPHNTYYGNSFSPEDELPLDFVLQNQQFYPRDINIKSIVNDGTRYVAVCESLTHSFVLISYDGISWNNFTISNTVLGVTDIVYFENQYVITTQTVTNPMLVSFDAENWISAGKSTLFDTVPFSDETYDSSAISSPPAQLHSVIYAQGYYYSVGEKILRSKDGVIWVEVYRFGGKLFNDIKDIIYTSSTNFDGFIAVGGGNQILSGIATAAPVTQTASVVITSVDGQVWELFSPSLTTASMNTVVASDELIVIAGNNAEIYYGVNGSNWTLANIVGSPITNTINGSVHANGRFVLVGNAGTILTSTDGITWIQVSSSDLTVSDLNSIYHDGMYFYSVGTNATVIRSMDGLSWSDVSYITTKEPFSVVKGSDFLYGYGPEELVAGVISDTLSLRVITAPGSYWDDTSLVGTSKYFENTGFNMVSKTVKPSLKMTVSFDKMVKNPAQVAVFVVTDSTGTGRRIYEDTATANNLISYTVNWINKVITLSAGLTSAESVLVEVYEVGNGKQIARSNSQLIPLRENQETGNSEIYLNVQYRPVITYPVAYHNGRQLQYLVDYNVTFAYGPFNYTRFIFNEKYDQSVDYISFALLDTSVNDLNPTEYMFSIPTTEIFTGDKTDGQDTFTVRGYVGGTNNINAIVELDGKRLTPTVGQYVIDGTTQELRITIDAALTGDNILAVTTYNETNRLYLETSYQVSMKVAPIYSVNVTSASTTVIVKEPLFNNEFNAGHVPLVRIDGLYGASNLNDVSFYVRQPTVDELKSFTENDFTDPENPIIVYYPYVLYSDITLTQQVIATTPYSNGGYIWLDRETFQVAQPIDPVTHPNTAPIRYNDGSRAWVTINGDRVDPSKLSYQPSNNKLNILVPINYSDIVVVTSMVDGPTPDAISYNINVDSKGNASVYRTNDNDGTWLTKDVQVGDQTIYVNDVNSITDTNESYLNVTQLGQTKLVYLNSDIHTIKEVTVFNDTTGIELDSAYFILTTTNNRTAIVFSNGVTVTDLVKISLRVGDIIEINGEKIRYARLDRNANTISGLTRGVLGTSPASLHATYDILYGIVPSRKLDDKYYGVTWNSSNYDETNGDPLQISDTPPANFLKYGYY